MNLVDLIKDQLSSGVIKQLSSQIDASEGATRSAVFAAVPALSSHSPAWLQRVVRDPRSSSRRSSNLASGSLESLVHKMSNHPPPFSSKVRAF